MKKTLLLLSMLSIGSIGAVFKVTNTTRFPNNISWQENGTWHYFTLEPKHYYTFDNTTQIWVSKFRGKYNPLLWVAAPTKNTDIYIQSVLNQYNKQNRTHRSEQPKLFTNKTDHNKYGFERRKRKQDEKEELIRELGQTNTKQHRNKNQQLMDDALNK